VARKVKASNESSESPLDRSDDLVVTADAAEEVGDIFRQILGHLVHLPACVERV